MNKYFLIPLSLALFSINCSAASVPESGYRFDNVISEFSAFIPSSTEKSKVQLVKNIIVKSSDIHVFNPWDDMFECGDIPIDNNAIIISNRTTTHILRSCAALDMPDITITQAPSTLIDDSYERSDYPSKSTISKELIMIPSEAGVDTFIGWNGKKYILLAPSEW